MNKLINELLETHLGRMIDESRDELSFADEICQQDKADLSELEEQYMALGLSKAEKMIVNNYVSGIQTAAHRIADISYIAGVRDTVRLLHGLDLLKGTEDSEEQKPESGLPPHNMKNL